MAALMNVIREEVVSTVTASTGALSTTTTTTASATLSRTVMTAVKQEAGSLVSTTTETSILKEVVGRTDGSGLLSATQLQTGTASPRELVSQAFQQGLESVGDTLMEGGNMPKN